MSENNRGVSPIEAEAQELLHSMNPEATVLIVDASTYRYPIPAGSPTFSRLMDAIEFQATTPDQVERYIARRASSIALSEVSGYVVPEKKKFHDDQYELFRLPPDSMAVSFFNTDDVVAGDPSQAVTHVNNFLLKFQRKNPTVLVRLTNLYGKDTSLHDFFAVSIAENSFIFLG